MKLINDTGIAEKTILGAIMMMLLMSPSHILRAAEDYPAEYLGSGFRQYLSDKMQNGYYVEVFTKMDMRQKERINKRSQVEEILVSSYQATPISSSVISTVASLEQYNSDNLKREIVVRRQQRVQNAAAQAEFNYIPYSDRKTVYFKDGLVSRIENERLVDEFGVSYRNSYNYQYDDKRLLIGFEADTKDNLGNITHSRQYGMKYAPDSVFYGNHKTRANQNLTEYFLEEMDPAGNKKLTHFYASTYQGKLLTAFSETIEDEISGNHSFTRSNIAYADNNAKHPSSYHQEGIGTDGLAYTLDRTNMGYNDRDQLTGYHEEITTLQIDGLKARTNVDAKFEYLSAPHQFGADVESEPGRLLKSTVTVIEENANGSIKTRTTTTAYNYDTNNQLMAATGKEVFHGQEESWYQYTGPQGQTLSKDVDEKGNINYFYYIDSTTGDTTIVPQYRVTATLKDGNLFRGTSEIQYEILSGKPMTKQARSITNYYNPDDNNLFRIEDSLLTHNNSLINNLQRVLSYKEYTKIISPLLDPDNTHIDYRDITTTNIYDSEGNLIDAQGLGTGRGWDYSDEKGWWRKHTKVITVDYEVFLGKALRKAYEEIKNEINNYE